ncbi:MAG TPA: spore germination protein GerW family protein [Candidatus Limnocylindria bacterium]|jgi:uncharacterized spore protein YtfJ
MNVDEMLQGARDAMAVSRVYGEPIERNGVTLIPAVDVRGAGAGGGDAEHTGGGGFGVSARPVGMWVIRGDDVAWEPSVDVTQITMRALVVGLIGLLVVRSVIKTLAKR